MHICSQWHLIPISGKHFNTFSTLGMAGRKRLSLMSGGMDSPGQSKQTLGL